MYQLKYMGVSKNRVSYPKSSILIGFSLIFTIHFGGPIFGSTPILCFSGLTKNLTTLKRLQAPVWSLD